MKKIQLFFKGISALLVLSFVALSCEQDDPDVGFGIIDQDQANSIRSYVDVIAYNLYNGDSIRSDEDVLTSAVFGAYTEGVFGKVKAAFVSQVRLPIVSPIFSDSIEAGLPKATIDSVVLYIKPAFFVDTESDDYTISIDTIFVDGNGDLYDQDTDDDVDTFRIVTKFPISARYGDENATMNVDVNTINEFLFNTEYTYYSNSFDQNTIKQDLLGSKEIASTLTQIEYKDSNSARLDTINGNFVKDVAPSIGIPLDANYFQNNIINKQGDPEFSDQSQFIRFINGIQVSVQENSGFLVNFNPNDVDLSMYYSFVSAKDDDGNINEGSAIYAFSINSSSNVKIGLYERDASTSSFLNPFIAGSNITTGDTQLFLDGMGGFKNIIAFDSTQIQNFRDNFKNNQWAIVGANLKLYKDPIASNLDNPTKIFAYKYDQNGLPNIVSDLEIDNYSFFEDLATFSSSPGYIFNPTYDTDEDPGYYQLRITEYVKNMVEKDSFIRPVIVEMGDFNLNTSGFYAGINETNTPYNPFRMVFKGSNLPTDNQRLRLEILYTNK